MEALQGIKRDFLPGKLSRSLWRNFPWLKQIHSGGKALVRAVPNTVERHSKVGLCVRFSD